MAAMRRVGEEIKDGAAVIKAVVGWARGPAALTGNQSRTKIDLWDDQDVISANHGVGLW